MKRNGLILLATAAFFLFAGQAFATVAVTTTPASGASIDGSSPFQIEINMDYAAAADMVGFGFSFGFTSPDGSIENVTYVDVGGDPEIPSIEYLNLFYPNYYSFILHVGAGLLLDGTLPDYVNFTTAGTAGMPGDLGNQAYIRFNLQVDYSTTGTTGQLCIDSVGATEAGGSPDWDWLFDPANGAVTFNGGNGAICWTITNLTPSDVHAVEESIALPTEFSLDQNYPNPFNPNTSFAFALPERSNVNLVVYNVLGQRVKTLTDGEYEAGNYIVDWDGTNEDGSASASGIYFYRLTANDFQSTRKMMLLK